MQVWTRKIQNMMENKWNVFKNLHGVAIIAAKKEERLQPGIEEETIWVIGPS